jgi:hypothetical protein
VAGSSYWGGIQFNVDGVTYNDSGNGGGAYSYRNGLSTLPSVDSVSEFKIDSNNQKAQFEGSASVTIVSKTGTNNFHGPYLSLIATRRSFNRNEFPPPGDIVQGLCENRVRPLRLSAPGIQLQGEGPSAAIPCWPARVITRRQAIKDVENHGLGVEALFDRSHRAHRSAAVMAYGQTPR